MRTCSTVAGWISITPPARKGGRAARKVERLSPGPLDACDRHVVVDVDDLPATRWRGANQRCVPLHPRLPDGKLGSGGRAVLEEQDAAASLRCLEPVGPSELGPREALLVDRERLAERAVHIRDTGHRLVAGSDVDRRVTAENVDHLGVVESLL